MTGFLLSGIRYRKFAWAVVRMDNAGALP